MATEARGDMRGSGKVAESMELYTSRTRTSELF